jgi:hypothetical protein
VRANRPCSPRRSPPAAKASVDALGGGRSGARQTYASRPAQDGLDLIEGEARFTGQNTVEVALTDGATRQVSAPAIVIDAGTRPRPLAIAGMSDVRVLDSTSITELDQLPEHLIIVGGGYIGLEFGQMFRRFGPPAPDRSHARRRAADSRLAPAVGQRSHPEYGGAHPGSTCPTTTTGS